MKRLAAAMLVILLLLSLGSCLASETDSGAQKERKIKKPIERDVSYDYDRCVGYLYVFDDADKIAYWRKFLCRDEFERSKKIYGRDIEKIWSDPKVCRIKGGYILLSRPFDKKPENFAMMIDMRTGQGYESSLPFLLEKTNLGHSTMRMMEDNGRDFAFPNELASQYPDFVNPNVKSSHPSRVIEALLKELSFRLKLSVRMKGFPEKCP